MYIEILTPNLIPPVVVQCSAETYNFFSGSLLDQAPHLQVTIRTKNTAMIRYTHHTFFSFFIFVKVGIIIMQGKVLPKMSVIIIKP